MTYLLQRLFDDASIRHAEGAARLRVGVEVVPAIHGFVPDLP
jgi:hypothetical protein